MASSVYKVQWTIYARLALARMKEYKVNPMSVFRRSIAVLSYLPSSKADGVSDFPDFEFNGYYWTLIENVVIVYKVDEQLHEVHVDACYFANTGTSHHIFWGIDPDEE